MKYTVVLAWEDGDSVVEWVEAFGPEEAVRKAVRKTQDRLDAWPVAVFTGHQIDVRGDIGRPWGGHDA